MKKYDSLVFICRCQPVHNAHVETIRRATLLANQVIVIIGSADRPRTYKNPFTAKERAHMLMRSVEDAGDRQAAVHIESNIDTIYNDNAWALRVQELVKKHTHGVGKIGIIGHDKDESTFYLKMFPQWGREYVELIEPLNATEIRDLYFREGMNLNFIRSVVPPATIEFLECFRNTPEFVQIIRERDFIREHDKQYAGLKYPPIFMTADAVVVCSGHVLMIKRRAEPGKGLWALPGGYVNAKTDKSVRDAMIRELREETKIKVPEPVIRGSIVSEKLFDAVERSPRGRIITQASFIELTQTELPHVKGSDDAEKAKWIPFADVKSDECFEDHWEIIQWALGQ